MIIQQKSSFFAHWTSQHGRDVFEATQVLRHRLRIVVALSAEWLQLLRFHSLLITEITHIAYDVRVMNAAGHGGTFSVLSLLISLSLLRSHGDHGWLFMLLLLCLLLELCKGAQEFDFSSLTPNRYFLRVFLKQMNSSASAFYTLKKTNKHRCS